MAVAILGVAAIGAAFLIDERLVHDDAVPRNVTLAGFDIGGMRQSELAALLDVIAHDVATSPVEVAVPPRTFSTTNRAAGIALDSQAMAETALNLGRGGDLVEQFEAWWHSLSRQRSVSLQYSYEPDATVAWIEAHPARVLTEPGEPSFTGRNGDFEIVDSVIGDKVDPVAVAASLGEAVANGGPPFAAEAGWVPLEPEVDQATFDAAVAAAEELAATPVTIRLGPHTVRLGRDTIRRWIDSKRRGGELEPVLAVDRIEASIPRLMAGRTTDPVPPQFAVVDGEVDVTLGEPAEECCGDGVGELIAEALLTGSNQIVDLPVVPVETREAQAARYGIRELVEEFTTNHACCQSRVNNIQRMADIVRGAIIEPGETFSLNEYVGERTRANGFVPAGTILSGRLVDTVGGGVSQFATTMFNAAFFAGFDFIEYQSHSIYISRYPYGREATINWPNVDLEIRNTTPYAAMLWTEYTGTSITVQVWSTPYYEVEQTGQSRGSWGRACTRVTTFRSRTTPEGQVIDDSVFATYRPGEGLDCNGNPTPNPFAE